MLACVHTSLAIHTLACVVSTSAHLGRWSVVRVHLFVHRSSHLVATLHTQHGRAARTHVGLHLARIARSSAHTHNTHTYTRGAADGHLALMDARWCACVRARLHTIAPTSLYPSAACSRASKLKTMGAFMHTYWFRSCLAARLQTTASSCESVQDIINIAATAEALAVTALGGALQSAAAGNLELNEEQQQVVAAARAAEQAHYDFLVAASAKALTLEFTLPDEQIVADVGIFLQP